MARVNDEYDDDWHGLRMSMNNRDARAATDADYEGDEDE